MFDIGWNELLLIAVVAIVVIGPKDLPKVMRLVGQWSGRVKRMGREFQNQFNEALREAELEDVKKSAADIGKEIAKAADVSTEMAKAEAEVRAGLSKPAEAAAPAIVPVEPAKDEPAKAAGGAGP